MPDGGASQSTEVARGSSTGTDVSLRDHFALAIEELDKRVDQRFEQNDKALQAALLAAKEAVAAALTAAKEAVDKAETAASKRFDSTNEFRGQLADQAAHFMSREVADTQFRELRSLVQALQDRVNITEGKSAGSERRRDTTQPWMLWAAGVLVVAASFAANHL
jgi:phosphopantetheinyl transferase (holo-ACP synthase)